MNKNKIIDVLRLVAGNNIMVAVTHRRNGITSNVIVNKVFDDNTIEIVEYGYTKTINLDNIGRLKYQQFFAIPNIIKYWVLLRLTALVL